MTLFNFELKSFDKCAMPSINNSKSLCWFWLTDSEYYLQFENTKIYESNIEWLQKYSISGSVFLYYHFIRFLEDFFGLLPNLARPIPEKWFHRLSTVTEFRKKVDSLDLIEFSEEEDQLFDLLLEFYNLGNLDSGFLATPPLIRFIHFEDQIHIYWDCSRKDETGLTPWLGGIGEYRIPYSDFLLEIEDLLRHFFCAMDKQLNDLKIYLETNPQQTEYILYDLYQERDRKKGISKNGFDYLLEEHQQRKEFFYSILNKTKNNDSPPFQWEQLETAWTTFDLDNKKG